MNYLIGLIIIAIVGMPVWHLIMRRRIETAKSLYFNRQAMPILLLPDHPFDEDFPDRIAAVQEYLSRTENPYNVKIIAAPYYTPIGDAQTINVNFDKYIQLQIEAWMEAREELAKEKFQRVPDFAAKKIAGFEIVNQPPRLNNP